MSFKINYKGAKLVKPYDYFCKECGHTCVINHTCRDIMSEPCPDCEDGVLVRHITKVPALDADHHESMRTRNLGWDSDEQE
jgi:hypothetical protein